MPEVGKADGADIGDRLLAAGLIDSAMLSSARRVLQQTPGKSLAEVLTDRGADEAEVQMVVAEVARLPFERVDGNDPNSYHAKAVHRLGPKFCQQNRALPLRQEGSRLIVGTTSPDDVFVLDDIKRQLGVASV